MKNYKGIRHSKNEIIFNLLFQFLYKIMDTNMTICHDKRVLF